VVYTSLVSDIPGGRRAKAVQGTLEIIRVAHRENFLPNLFMNK